MENRVTKKELNECIKNAENIVEKMLSAIEEAKNITIKTEEFGTSDLNLKPFV